MVRPEPARRRHNPVRLYVEGPLAAGAPLTLPAGAAHYLGAVMRLAQGAPVLVFNGRDGEWRAIITELSRKGGVLVVEAQTRRQERGPDLWLVFAPLKYGRIDYLVAKAAEIGAAALLPVLSARTTVARVNGQRLRANAIEAAEQCERLDVPQVLDAVPFSRLFGAWDAGRRLLFCDEGGGPPIADVLFAEAARGRGAKAGPWAVLVGPEGGFTEEERALLRALPHCLRVSLGPRLLRAETAAVSALSLWQAILGDWSERPTSTIS